MTTTVDFVLVYVRYVFTHLATRVAAAAALVDTSTNYAGNVTLGIPRRLSCRHWNQFHIPFQCWFQLVVVVVNVGVCLIHHG